MFESVEGQISLFVSMWHISVIKSVVTDFSGLVHLSTSTSTLTVVSIAHVRFYWSPDIKLDPVRSP